MFHFKVRTYNCIFFCFLLITTQSYSQKRNFQKYSIKEGLSQSTVNQIEQDDYGNFWLATNYGLSKFNGITFENYTTSNGLPSNEISNLLFTEKYLFIGTKHGLCFFDGGKIDHNSATRRIKGQVVKILKRKNILHIISTSGYYTLDISSPQFALDSVSISNIISQKPTDAEFDEDDNLWISTAKRGLFFIERNISTKIPKFFLIQNAVSSTSINKKLTRVVNFNSDNLFKSNRLFSIEFDNKKNLLVSDWSNGIAEIKFDAINTNGFSAKYTTFDSIPNKPIRIDRFNNIQKDENGNIYFASDGFGFIEIESDKNTNEYDYSGKNGLWISSDKGLFGNNPLCFKTDKTNSLWIGTLNDGLVLMSNKNSFNYNKQSGLEEEKILSVYKASDSSIWVGTFGGGAFKLKDKKFTRCFWEQGISESIVKSIAEDGSGNILLGTTGGGISIIPKVNTEKNLHVERKITTNDNLTSNYISFLFRAKNGAIWVGYELGNRIDRIIINKDLSYKITSFIVTDLLNFHTTCLAEDNDGQIWISSNEGVWHLNPSTNYVNDEYVIFKNIQTISKDWNGNMWLGSSDIGVIIIKNKIKVRYFDEGSQNAFEKLTTKNGITSNCVNTILFKDDLAWLVSNNGLDLVKIDSYLNKIKEIKTYNKGLGFASFDNKPNASVLDDNNFIWIGSVEGLSHYTSINNIDETAANKNLIVFINSLLIENKEVDWTNTSLFESGEYSSIKFDGFYNWYKIPKNLELDYMHNSVQFHVSTNSIVDQKDIIYMYKLIGYDKNWNTLRGNNDITYRNLPAGDYSLIVKASLSNNFSDSQEFSYQFSIKTPFWKSTWFYVLLLILFVFAVSYFIVNRERRLIRERMKLEVQVRQRTSEIEKTKKEIEQQNILIKGINKDLTDSIIYAERIQQSILPNTMMLSDYFSDNAILYMPRSIVSGDYYWIKELNGLIYIAVVDCTGHGVPGAFMSLITSNILNESIKNSGNWKATWNSPINILEYLRKEINVRLSQNTEDVINDGVDISIICFDKQNKTVEYVNANRPMYVLSNNSIKIVESDHLNIGRFDDISKPIQSKIIQVNHGDTIFLFTDGLTDQFGGLHNKKYNPARLRRFILENSNLNLSDLKDKLVQDVVSWQGDFEQTDDMLLLALKV